jgi:hypothetical protein
LEQPEAAVHITTVEDITIWNIMKEDLKYAEEEDRLVQTSHIDYI